MTDSKSRSYQQSRIWALSPPPSASKSAARSNEFGSSSTLVLKNKCLFPGDLKLVCDRLARPLKSIEINRCWCDFEFKKSDERKLMIELVEELEASHTKLESVQLKGVFPRNHEDVIAILNALRGCKMLEEVAFMVPEERKIPFGVEWIPLTKANPCLCRISLESFDLSESNASIQNMITALKHSVGLRQIFLGGCRIDDKGLWNLVSNLDHMRRIRQLQIPQSSSLTMVTLLTMASLMTLNTELQVLDLTGNDRVFAPLVRENEEKVSDEEYAHQNHQREGYLTTFMKSLQDNVSLVELRLAYCGIHDDVFQFLLCCLERNHTLKILNLDYNYITRKVGLRQHLTQALPLIKLAELSLRGLKNKHGENDDHHWKAHHLTNFLAALEKNTSLTALTLDQVKQAEGIDEILGRNGNLQLVQKYQKLKVSGSAENDREH